MLDTTYEVGLSSTSRLHDLFVSHEAMPPGAYRAKGEGLEMIWGVAPSPFGTAVLTVTEYGLSGIGFADETMTHRAGLRRSRQPLAQCPLQPRRRAVAPIAARVFDPAPLECRSSRSGWC